MRGGGGGWVAFTTYGICNASSLVTLVYLESRNLWEKTIFKVRNWKPDECSDNERNRKNLAHPVSICPLLWYYLISLKGFSLFSLKSSIQKREREPSFFFLSFSFYPCVVKEEALLEEVGDFQKMIRWWIYALQFAELLVSSLVHMLYGFYIFSTAVAGDLSQALTDRFFKPNANIEVKSEDPSGTNFDDLPPIVLVHGIFGFGKGVCFLLISSSFLFFP